jgi:hypothetical protein
MIIQDFRKIMSDLVGTTFVRGIDLVVMKYGKK